MRDILTCNQLNSSSAKFSVIKAQFSHLLMKLEYPEADAGRTQAGCPFS